MKITTNLTTERPLIEGATIVKGEGEIAAIRASLLLATLIESAKEATTRNPLVRVLIADEATTIRVYYEPAGNPSRVEVAA